MARFTILAIAMLAIVFVTNRGTLAAEKASVEQAPASDAAAGDNDFAAQASDALDGTLLQIKNTLSTFFNDGEKITNFFSNVTNHLKKLTQTKDDPAAA